MSRPFHPARPWARLRLFAHALACVSVLTVTAGGSQAATSSVVVTMDVPSATTLDATGCAPDDPDRTALGVVQPGTQAVTSLDCNVLFGSSNDSSTLRVWQSDGDGDAMAAFPTSTVSGDLDHRTNDVDMADAATGWAVGDGTNTNNRIYKTPDGGATWSAVSTATATGNLEGIDAVSSTVAWANGNNTNLVTRTTDGTNWTSATGDLPATARLNAIAAASSTHAWGLGWETVGSTTEGRVWRTTNGGTNWTLVYSTTANEIADGAAFSTTDVWIAESTGRVYHATDGVTFAISSPNAGGITAFGARAPNTVAAVTSDGELVVTTNGGTSWNVRDTNIRGAVWDLDVSPDGTLWIVGMKGLIGRSGDVGVSWSSIENPHEAAFMRTVSTPANGHAVIGLHSRTVLRTIDDGATWTVARNSGAGILNWTAIDGPDATSLWRVGGGGAVSTSSDSGDTWTPQATPTTKALADVVALDRSTVVAVGAGGTVIRTTNGGSNWALVATPTGQRLNTITAAPDGRTLVAAGESGVMVVSGDAGASWSSVATGTTESITALAAWNSTDWIFGTTQITARTTTDGGATWTTRATGATEGFTDAVIAHDSSIAYLLYDDNLAITPDFGASWSTEEIPSSGQRLALDYAYPDTVWVTGQWNAIWQGTSQGSVWRQVSSGSSGFGHGIVALGPEAAVLAMDGHRRERTTQTVAIPDYGGTEWGTSTGLFGICLRAAPGATNTWPTTGSCPQANGTNWRAVPLAWDVPASRVADLAAPGTTTASFRFGLNVAAAQPPGTYAAPITFEVVAPLA